jgi:HAAS domain-containing protein
VAGVIEGYVAALRRELDFDPALARRMADEIEAHLWDAAESDPAWPSPEAERRAVERFGLAREIAGQFAADAVNHQARRIWMALLATVAVTFVAMRLRVMWLGDVGDSLSVLAPLVDRYAFLAALGVAAIGWFAFRRSLVPLAICLAALVASIAAGILRAGLLVEAAPLPVLLTAAGEIALIGLLSFHVIVLGRRLRRTAVLRRAG